MALKLHPFKIWKTYFFLQCFSLWYFMLKSRKYPRNSTSIQLKNFKIRPSVVIFNRWKIKPIKRTQKTKDKKYLDAIVNNYEDGLWFYRLESLLFLGCCRNDKNLKLIYNMQLKKIFIQNLKLSGFNFQFQIEIFQYFKYLIYNSMA